MNVPVWVVVDVQPKEDYSLLLTFVSGEKKVYDARPLLKKAIYEQLNDITFFLGAKAECGTVVWSDDIDIATEHLYEKSRPLGMSSLD